ncbi:MAG: hypothetical protein PVH25_05525 [Burkholderiales bacterium]|jgi:hypothetical protein
MLVTRLILVVLTSVLLATLANAQEAGEPAQPQTGQSCRDCGVIYDIRTITSERAAAKTFVDETPPAGPYIRFPLSKSPDEKAEVGVYGNERQRAELERTTYEVVVRFDDGRYTLIEMDDASGFRIGERVRVHQNRVEPVDEQ